MATPDKTQFQGIGTIILIAVSVLVLGLLVFSVHTLFMIGKPKPAHTQRLKTKTEQPTETSMPAAEPDMHAFKGVESPPPVPRNFELDPETLMVRQELSREQAQAFRTIAREQTNLSFQLTEEEIQIIEKEGLRVK